MSNSLTPRDKELIKREFNEDGYVLDFTNATFASFTLSSVGISIQDKYGLSKGRSLEQFFEESDDELCSKLLNDLIQKRRDMDLFGDAKINSSEERILTECEQIAKRLSFEQSAVELQKTILTNSEFNTDYIEKQVVQMYNSIDENPTEAIGKSKELLESCAKTILKARGIEYSQCDSFSGLMSTLYKELDIHRNSVPDDKKASDTIKRTLSSISTIINGINDLRKDYGSGHGKENDYKGLSRRHARLAVGISSAATSFLWDTHKAKG